MSAFLRGGDHRVASFSFSFFGQRKTTPDIKIVVLQSLAEVE